MKKIFSILIFIFALVELSFSQVATKPPQDTANARLALIKNSSYRLETKDKYINGKLDSLIASQYDTYLGYNESSADILHYMKIQDLFYYEETFIKLDSIDKVNERIDTKLNIIKLNTDTAKQYIARQSEIINITGLASITSTLYAVTASKDFYMTGYCISAVGSSSVNASYWTLEDVTVDKGTFYAPAWNAATQQYITVPYAIKFDNPVKFDTNVKMTSNNGTGIIIYNIYGYER